MTNDCQQSTPTICAIGIDVAKETLSICRRYSDGQKDISVIDNNEADITKYIKKNLQQVDGKVILESTGRYHYLGAITFAEHDFDVRVINPLITKKYSSSSIRKVKTDAKDAELLADIALKEDKLPESFSANRHDLEIRKKIGLLGSLEKLLQQYKSILRDYSETKQQLSMKLSSVEKELLKLAKELVATKEKLEQEISKLANSNVARAEQSNRYVSIPGVSKYMADVSSYFFGQDYDRSPKQWIAYAGLDVSIKQSGKWNGRGKLTKRGNPYLRKRLFCAAWGAMMHNQDFKKYYQYLRQKQNRSYVEAMTIISRKLVRIMFNLTKNKTMYSSALINLPAEI